MKDRALFFLLLITSLLACKQNSQVSNTDSQLYINDTKCHIGYLNNKPVFDVAGQNNLLVLKDDSAKSFYTYDSIITPICIQDSILFFSSEGKVYLTSTSFFNPKLIADKPVANIEYNPNDSCVFFSEGYEYKIMKLNVVSGREEIINLDGIFLAVREDKLFYYKYNSDEFVSASVDLFMLNLTKNETPTKIASQLSEEFLVISSDGNYLISDNNLDTKNRPFVYCIMNKTSHAIEKEIPDNFIHDYYNELDEEFIYYNMHSLKKIKIPLKCKNQQNI